MGGLKQAPSAPMVLTKAGSPVCPAELTRGSGVALNACPAGGPWAEAMEESWALFQTVRGQEQSGDLSQEVTTKDHRAHPGLITARVLRQHEAGRAESKGHWDNRAPKVSNETLRVGQRCRLACCSTCPLSGERL